MEEIPDKYSLFNNQEKSFLGPYLTSGNGENEGLLKSYLDSNRQITRITAQNGRRGGPTGMETILSELKPKVDSIFPNDKYTVNFTGFISGLVSRVPIIW